MEVQRKIKPIVSAVQGALAEQRKAGLRAKKRELRARAAKILSVNPELLKDNEQKSV